MSSLWTDLAVGARIGRAAATDRFRRHTSSRREKALFGLIALFVAPGILLFAQQAYTAGTLARDGVDAPVIAVARNVLLPSMLVFTVIAGLEAIQQLGSDSVRSLVLTSAPERAIVIGKVISLLVSWLILLAVGFALVIAFAAGARAPLFPVVLFIAAMPVFVLVLLAGLSLGYLLWLGVERFGLSEGGRQVLTAALYLVIVALMFGAGSLVGGASAEQGATEFLPTDEPATPVGWYADLFFVGSPMSPSLGIETALGAGIILGSIPLAFALVVRLAPLYWYATPRTDENTERAATEKRLPSATIGRVEGTITGRVPTVRVAVATLRNARRKPSQFVYLFYYLFPVAPVLAQQAVGNPGALPLTVGASLVVLGVWLAGGVFCLNPLGGEGTMLSQIVLADRPAETFIHARLLVGSALGVGLTTVGILVVTAVSEQVTPLIGGVGVVFVAIAAVTSGALALGLGSVLPKFEAVEIFESVETVAPSIIAALVHAVVSALLLLGAVAVTVLIAAAESPVSIGQQLAVVTAFLVTAVIITDGSRRYAIARLRDYGRETARTDRPFAIYVSISLAAIAFLLGQALATAVLLFFSIDPAGELLFPVLFVIQYLAFALVGIGFLYATHRGLAYVDLSMPTVRHLTITAGGVIVTLGIWLAASVVISGLGLPAADHALFDADADATERLLLLLIPLVLFINGPVEEFLYRNVIQKYLSERFSTGSAIGIASVVFAIAHVPAYLTAGLGPLTTTLSLLFLVSCFWGLLYAWTESLFVVSAIHGLYNAVLVGVLYLQIT